MRPSWPAPTMPMVLMLVTGVVAIGGFIYAKGRGISNTTRVCSRRKASSRLRMGADWVARMAAREQRCIHGTGFADGQGAHRDARGHLCDGEQGIDALQGLGFHRHTQHRQAGLGGGHARQMGGPTSTGDDHP